MTLITRMTAEVAADEAELRERIVELIDGGRMDDAKALLCAWNLMAAGDVLKQYASREDGRSG